MSDADEGGRWFQISIAKILLSMTLLALSLGWWRDCSAPSERIEQLDRKFVMQRKKTDQVRGRVLVEQSRNDSLRGIVELQVNQLDALEKQIGQR